MRFDAKNGDELKNLYLHDAFFTGFDYDYLENTVIFECIQMHTGLWHQLVFQGVLDIDMQACGFWGGGNAVFSVGLGGVDKLEAYRRINWENPVFRSDWQEAALLPVAIQLNSGDQLNILCRALDVHSRAFEWPELILPGRDKRRWDFCAQLVCARTDEELADHLPRLLEWLQDMNWPGATRIAQRLCGMDAQILRPALAAACEEAEKENDEEWLENLRAAFGAMIP